MQSHCWQFDAYGSPEIALAWRQQTLPAPGPGQALIRLRAIGMNRSEFNYVQGRYAPARQFPSCLGQEAVGEIIALGANAGNPQAFNTGDRVALLPGRVDLCAMGTYRDVGLYDLAALAPVPEDYSDAEGAALWMAVLTMAGALLRAGIEPDNANGKRVVITAASSGMGVYALKLARAWGAHTVATTRSMDKATQLQSIADQVVVCEESGDLARELSHALGTQGFDVALDPVGQAYYPGLIASASIGARIVSYEMISGREPVVPIPQLMLKDLSLMGYTIFRAYREPGLLDRLIDIGLRYSAATRPLIADRLPLPDAPAALLRLGRADHLGKLILTP